MRHLPKHSAYISPQALGALVNPSTYGQTIPVIYGRTLGSLLPIWNINIRKFGGSSGFFGLGSSQGEWIQNVDFLIGHNPIAGVLQFLVEGGYIIPLDFKTYSFTFDGGHTTQSVSIPDSRFYALIGVTAVVPYSASFNDYGAPGPVSASGNFEVPMWNVAYQGPDPVNSNAIRYGKYIYYWLPGSSGTVQFPTEFRFNHDGWLNSNDVQVNFYYAAVKNNPPAWPKGANSPMSLLRLTFEPQLGDGPEFVGYPSYRITYPSYAGAGSVVYDMGPDDGSTPPTAYPNNQPEVLGMFPVYPTGDADFADMIEDIFKSGPVQSGPGNSEGANIGRIHHGLDSCDYPGAIQMATIADNVGAGEALFGQPQVLNDLLLVYARIDTTGSGPTLSDTAGDTFTQIASGGPSPVPYRSWWSIWTASAKAAAAGNLFSNPTSGFHQTLIPMELNGLDTLDGSPVTVAVQNGPQKISITTTNPRFTPAMIYAFTEIPNATAGPLDPTPLDPRWKIISLFVGGCIQCFGPVWAPGTVSLQNNFSTQQFGTTTLVAFKNSQMGNYPRTLGNILDDTTMQLVRNQCRAFGLWGSYNLNSQKSAKDVLEDLYLCSDAAPVWSGFKLKSIPWSEESGVGNGAVYTAYTANGPAVDLNESDFIGDADTPPLTFERKARFDALPTHSISIYDRNSNYAPSEVDEPTAAGIALFGTKKADPKRLDMIMDPAIARKLVTIQARRDSLIMGKWTGKLTSKHQLRESMDLVTLTEPKIGLFKLPARITSIQENEDFTLVVEFENFFYGLHCPVAVSIDSSQQNAATPFADPGSINTPIIFEPVPMLYNNQNVQQLWFVISGASANYGGCVVYISTDGGNSYNFLGQINGNATTGLLAADYPSAADPDTVDTLSVDLTESLGSLTSYLAADRDAFTYPCYLGNGNLSLSPIPYELMTYATANQTGTFAYNLIPYTRRAVFGAPLTAMGVDHPIGTRFAFLTPGDTPVGILKVPMNPTWLGKTLYFKFPAYNNLVSGFTQSLANVTPYTYSPSSVVGTVNPFGLPPGVVALG